MMDFAECSALWRFFCIHPLTDTFQQPFLWLVGCPSVFMLWWNTDEPVILLIDWFAKAIKLICLSVSGFVRTNMVNPQDEAVEPAAALCVRMEQEVWCSFLWTQRFLLWNLPKQSSIKGKCEFPRLFAAELIYFIGCREKRKEETENVVRYFRGDGDYIPLQGCDSALFRKKTPDDDLFFLQQEFPDYFSDLRENKN